MVLSNSRLDPGTVAPLLWSRDEWARTQFKALGTMCQLIFRPASRRQGLEFRDAAVSWLMDFERKYSRYREDSMISAINAAAGHQWVETDAELESLLALCDHYHWSTAGVFDPSALPLQRLWDYQTEKPCIPSDEAIAQTLDVVGWQRVQRRPGEIFLPEKGMAMDLGGIGKEYAVDRVVDQARAAGIEHVMVDLGRDVRGSGQSPAGGWWRVGLEHPADIGQCWGGVAVANRAVATSGAYLRGFQYNGRFYSHIIDPRTGRPVETGCRSASVIAPTCTEAGVLSTTALILGLDEGLAQIERSTLSQGCVWQGETRHDSSRFAAYLL